MSQARLDAYVAELERRYRLPHRAQGHSRLHRAIDRFLRVITLGQMTSYMDTFQTTIGRTLYVTPGWDDEDPDERYVTLRHEAVHLAQFRRYTVPGMFLLYVLLPLPMGLALGRAHFEKQAYAEQIRAAAEVWGPEHPRRPAYRAYVVSQFTSPAYGWMWPFRKAMERWYDRVLATL
jgi:hypothetical protein